MGIMAPGGGGQWPARPPTASPKHAKKSPPAEQPQTQEFDTYQSCDWCGNSKIDNSPIARAVAQLYILTGSLFLCGHHFRISLPYILERGYYFRTLNYGPSEQKHIPTLDLH